MVQSSATSGEGVLESPRDTCQHSGAVFVLNSSHVAWVNGAPNVNERHGAFCSACFSAAGYMCRTCCGARLLDACACTAPLHACAAGAGVAAASRDVQGSWRRGAYRFPADACNLAWIAPVSPTTLSDGASALPACVCLCCVTLTQRATPSSAPLATGRSPNDHSTPPTVATDPAGTSWPGLLSHQQPAMPRARPVLSPTWLPQLWSTPRRRQRRCVHLAQVTWVVRPVAYHTHPHTRTHTRTHGSVAYWN